MEDSFWKFYSKKLFCNCFLLLLKNFFVLYNAGGISQSMSGIDKICGNSWPHIIIPIWIWAGKLNVYNDKLMKSWRQLTKPWWNSRWSFSCVNDVSLSAANIGSAFYKRPRFNFMPAWILAINGAAQRQWSFRMLF